MKTLIYLIGFYDNFEPTLSDYIHVIKKWNTPSSVKKENRKKHLLFLHPFNWMRRQSHDVGGIVRSEDFDIDYAARATKNFIFEILDLYPFHIPFFIFRTVSPNGIISVSHAINQMEKIKRFLLFENFGYEEYDNEFEVCRRIHI